MIFLGISYFKPKDATKTTSTFEQAGSISRAITQKEDWHAQRRDSLFTEADVLIWPKGIITYSPGGGFTGEVFKMKLHNKALRQVLTEEKGSSTQKMQTIIKEQTKASSKNRVQSKIRSIGVWKYWLFAMVLLLVGAIWFYRYIKNRGWL